MKIIWELFTFLTRAYVRFEEKKFKNMLCILNNYEPNKKATQILSKNNHTNKQKTHKPKHLLTLSRQQDHCPVNPDKAFQAFFVFLKIKVTQMNLYFQNLKKIHIGSGWYAQRLAFCQRKRKKDLSVDVIFL